MVESTRTFRSLESSLSFKTEREDHQRSRSVPHASQVPRGSARASARANSLGRRARAPRFGRALVSARTPTNFDFSVGLLREVTKDGVTTTERLGRTHVLRRYGALVKACADAHAASGPHSTPR